jgi:hypothetical protein
MRMRHRTLAEVGSAHDGRVRIYAEENEVGGRRYWSDAIGGGIVIWDTALVSPEELVTCLGIEERSRTQEEAALGKAKSRELRSRNGAGPEPDAREVGPQGHPPDGSQKLPGDLPGHGDDRPVPQQDHEG